jgi:putative PIN family toxin of toxin-antitoxin system
VIAGDTPRVVFDCNVLLQAVASDDGPSAACIRQVESNRIHVFVSRATMKEFRAVTKYPTIRRRNPDLGDEQVADFVARLMFRATFVRSVRHVFDYPRAPQDEQYVDLAIAAKANYLVSRDKDLLSLMSDHSPAGKLFRRLSHQLRIVDPLGFLGAIGHALKAYSGG